LIGLKNGVASEIKETFEKILGADFERKKYSPDPKLIGALKRKIDRYEGELSQGDTAGETEEKKTDKKD
jgi:hypothetical protein